MSTELLSELIEAGVHLGRSGTSSRPVRRKNVLSVEEARLWERINRTLSSAKLLRYRELLKRAEGATLTELEHQDIQKLTDEVESLHADRVKAILHLAALRGHPVELIAKSADIKI